MIKTKGNKKTHLSKEEMFCIEKMCQRGVSLSDIAKTLGRGKSTLSEVVKANGGREKFSAKAAIQRAYWKQYRKKKDCNKVATDGHLSRFVEKRLESGWSPEAISSRLSTQSGLAYASPKSIRKFVDRRPRLERYLFWNRNDHKSGHKRKSTLFLTDPDRKWIEMRPSEALFSYGHWEMDFIVSKYNSWVLLVCVEKYSKLIRLAVLPNRTTGVVADALTRILTGFVVKSITTDNDIAFQKWKELEQLLGTQIYFCHPYHSWEKGLVENCNRWIREFVPKKTDLQVIGHTFVESIELYFNHKPRECLEGYTPYEMMMERECGMLVESLTVNFPVRIVG